MQEGECKQEDGGSAQAGVLCADLPGWRVVYMRARDHSAMTRSCYMFTYCVLRELSAVHVLCCLQNETHTPLPVHYQNQIIIDGQIGGPKSPAAASTGRRQSATGRSKRLVLSHIV